MLSVRKHINQCPLFQRPETLSIKKKLFPFFLSVAKPELSSKICPNMVGSGKNIFRLNRRSNRLLFKKLMVNKINFSLRTSIEFPEISWKS
jgi:hypothetical protein